MDACKIAKGLESKFGNFVTKAAVIPEAQVETKAEEETKATTKKDTKKETKKESAGLSPAETKDCRSITFAQVLFLK